MSSEFKDEDCLACKAYGHYEFCQDMIERGNCPIPEKELEQ